MKKVLPGVLALCAVSAALFARPVPEGGFEFDGNRAINRYRGRRPRVHPGGNRPTGRKTRC